MEGSKNVSNDNLIHGLNYTQPPTSPTVAHELMIDFHTNIEDLQEQFKDRYNKLKEIYEARLKSLSTQVRETYLAVVHDDAITAMQDSDVTSPFIMERSQEIAEASLNTEREKSFQALAGEVAKKDADIKHLKRHNERLSEEIDNLQQQVSRIPYLESELEASKKRLKVTKEKLKNYIEKQGEESHQVELALNKLRSSISGGGGNNNDMYFNNSTTNVRTNFEMDSENNNNNNNNNNINDPTISAALSRLRESIQTSPLRNQQPNFNMNNRESKISYGNAGGIITSPQSPMQPLGISNIQTAGSTAFTSRAIYVDRVTIAENNLKEYDIQRQTEVQRSGNINDVNDDRREQLIEELTDAHNALMLFDQQQGLSSYRNAASSRMQGMFKSSLADTKIIEKLKKRRQVDVGRSIGNNRPNVEYLETKLAESKQDYEEKIKKMLEEKEREIHALKLAHDKLIIQLQTQIEENKKKVKTVKEKAKEVKKDWKKSKKSLEETVKLLEQSEKERLELREKYVKLGEKMESIAEMDTKVKESDHAKYKDKIIRLKEKIHDAHKHMKELKHDFKDQMRSKQEDLNEAADEINELKKQIENASKEYAIAKVNLAAANEVARGVDELQKQVTALRTDLDIANARLIDEPQRVEEAVRLRMDSMEKKVNEKEMEIVKLTADLNMKNAAEQRDRNEVERETQKRVGLERQKMEDKYKLLINEKLKDLDEAQKKAREANEDAKKREDNLREKVNKRLLENARDHISLKQHEEVLKTRLNALRVEMNNKQRAIQVRKETDLNARMKDKGRELEGNFRAAEGRMQQQILDLQNELDDAKQKAEDMEMRSKEDRQVMMEHRANADSERHKNMMLTQHLEEASMNIGHLKQMMEQARDRADDLNEKLEDLQGKHEEQNLRNEELNTIIETKTKEQDAIAEKIAISENDTQMLARSSVKESVISLLMVLRMLNTFKNKKKGSTSSNRSSSEMDHELNSFMSALKVDETTNTEDMTRLGLSERVAQAEYALMQHDKTVHERYLGAVAQASSEENAFREKVKSAEEELKEKKQAFSNGLSEDDNNYIKSKAKEISMDLVLSIEGHIEEESDLEQKIKNSLFLHDNANSESERRDVREKIQSYRVLREQSKRDRTEEERTLANNENRVRQDLLHQRKQDVEKAKEVVTNAKMKLSTHIVNRIKILAELRKKQFSDREFVRGRFLAAMQDLQAHDRGVIDRIVKGDKKLPGQSELNEKIKRRKTLILDLRKATKEKNEQFKAVTLEVESKKSDALEALNEAKTRRAQAERLLAAFDVAVDEASGGNGKKPAHKKNPDRRRTRTRHRNKKDEADKDNNDESTNGKGKKMKKKKDEAGDPNKREELVEECHLADDEVRNMEVDYNQLVEEMDELKEQRLKVHLNNVRKAKAALDKFDQNLLKDEERERKTAIALDVQYETFKRKQFLDKDRNGSNWIRHAISMIKREMDEFGSVSALAIENISNSNVQMKVIQELDNSRNMLRKSLKEAEEQLRKDTGEYGMLEKSLLKMSRSNNDSINVYEKTKNLPSRTSTVISYSETDGTPVVDISGENFGVQLLKSSFTDIVRYMTCLKHGLMDEIAKRNVLEIVLEKKTEALQDLTQTMTMQKKMIDNSTREYDEAQESNKRLLDNINSHQREMQTLQVNLNTAKSRVRRDAIDNQTLDEEKRMLLKEIETLKRTLKLEIQKSNDLQSDIQHGKATWNSERVALESKTANLKAIIKEKSIYINSQKEKFGKIRMKYESTLRQVVRKMKEQLSNIRLKSTNEIDNMRNDIYKYVREMQSKFRNALTEMYAKAQKNAQKSYEELRKQFALDNDRLNKAHKEEIQRMQDMHNATMQSLEHRISSSKQNADQEVERLETFKAELLEKQVSENNALQGKNSELEYKVSQSESRVRELTLSIESYKEDFKKYKKDILTLERDMDNARNERENMQESLRTREMEHQETISTLKKRLNNYDGTLIALSAHIHIPQKVQEALLSTDKASYSNGLKQLQNIVQDSLEQSAEAQKIYTIEESKKTIRELTNKLDTASTLHKDDILNLQTQLESALIEVSTSKREKMEAVNEMKQLQLAVELQKKEMATMQNEIEREKQLSKMQMQDIKERSETDIANLKATIDAEDKFKSSKVQLEKEQMQKEIEMEKMKVREERARKMAELDNEKVRMEIEMEAARTKLEREILAQKEAMQSQIEQQKREMYEQSAQFHTINQLNVESSTSEIMTELAQSKQERLRLELENEKLRSDNNKYSNNLLSQSQVQIKSIKDRYEAEMATLRKKNALDHKRMRILRNELAQQAEEADRLINNERSKLNTVLSRHTKAESRIAELTNEMNLLRSTVGGTSTIGVGSTDSSSSSSSSRRVGSSSQRVHITRTGSVYVDAPATTTTTGSDNNAESRLSMDNLK